MKKNKWNYGGSWERYPIKEDEIWIEKNTNSKFMVHDLYHGLPEFMLEADLIYCDPPWNTGNINSFYTKAGINKTRDFKEFTEVLFKHVKTINPKTCYLEIGKQNVKLFVKKMEEIFEYVQSWEVTYYRKNPSFLIRGSHISYTERNFTGMDDMDTPWWAMKNEEFNCVADLCTGQGLIPETAYKLGKKFVGTELNKRRMAVAIEKIVKQGGIFDEEDIS